MKNILIVDDDIQLQKLYKIIISQRFEGINLSQAFNGREALDICDTSDYSAIISDIDMPTMNGIDFYKKLKALRPELAQRLAFVSASSTADHISFIKDEACSYLPKPFNIDGLTKMLESMLSKSEDTAKPALKSEYKRQFPRVHVKGRCVLESSSAFPISEPLITETINYSGGGVLIEYSGSELPSGSNYNVKIETLEIKSKMAEVVWSDTHESLIKSGLKWI